MRHDRRWLSAVGLLALAAMGWWVLARAEETGVAWDAPADEYDEEADDPPAPALIRALPVAQTTPGTTSAPAQPAITLVDGDGKPVPAARLLLLNYDDWQKDNFTIKLDPPFVGIDQAGLLVVAVGGAITSTTRAADAKPPAFPYLIQLDPIADQGVQQLHVTWTPDAQDGQQSVQSSQPLAVKLDTRGPLLDSVYLMGDPALGMTLVLQFADDDLHPATAQSAANYTIAPVQDDDSLGPKLVIADSQITQDGKVVRINVGRLYTGIYQLTVNGTKTTTLANGDKVPPLRDLSGNLAGGQGADPSRAKDQTRRFSSMPQAEHGPRIEFPEFLPTAPQPKPERKPNPGDRVETRVVRLYYFRDAHRVAQLINRTAQSYNRAAVTQAQRRAEDARVAADKATDERRHDEREAVHAAEQLRQAEHALAAALQNANATQQQAAPIQQQLDAATAQQTNADSNITRLNAEIADLNTKLLQPTGQPTAPGTTVPPPSPPAPGGTQAPATSDTEATAAAPKRRGFGMLRKLSFRSAAPQSATDGTASAPTEQTLILQNQLDLANQQSAQYQKQSDEGAKLVSDLKAKLAEIDVAGAQSYDAQIN